MSKVKNVCPSQIEILDIDPYGSPMLILREFLNRYEGSIKKIVLTDGLLTSVRLKRLVNLYKYYNLLPNRVIKTETWHYRNFPSLLFSAVKDIVQRKHFCITDFEYEYNRYKTAIYAKFDLEVCG